MLRFLPLCGLLVLACGCANGSSGEVDPFGDAGPDATGPGTIGDDGAAGSVDGTIPSATCVHNSDCAAGVSNLCAGNNGVACLGGFCVPTGKPEDCDDGISCTDDSCDANTGACVHTPNDTECQAGAYCDPTENCVASLPCTPGDAVCDRLDTSPCAGLWSCSATLQVCVQASAPCASIPNAVTLCDGSADAGAVPIVDGGSVACSWECNPGYAHLEWNGSSWVQVTAIAPPPDTGGCECAITEIDGGVAYDPPDLAFADSNCDGIDGTAATAIFVDGTGGSDSNTGTMASPVRSIHQGITNAANSSGAKTDVYVSKGIYPETVTMADGVSIYGGYDASNKWSRGSANTTTIDGQQIVGVYAQNMTRQSQVQLFTITSQGATASSGDGVSSIGILVTNASNFTVRGATITAGSGAPGNAGSDGSTGLAGSAGGAASGAVGGGQGPSTCALGGQGGNGIAGTTNGGNGSGGAQATGGGQGAGGGSGGTGGSCSDLSSNAGYNASSVNTPGSSGFAGQNGGVGGTVGTLSSGGSFYVPAAGGSGSSGTPGGGGGGAGAGGGSAHADNAAPFDFCTDCNDSVAGGGGGGGGGAGCGGSGGAGGHGGGGSFAIVALSSTLTIDSVTMTTGIGGAGGTGGNGGQGGAAGAGGTGAPGLVDSRGSCSSQNGGAGGNGSSGGAGGQGGAGAGGTGGPSICLFYQGNAPTVIGSNPCVNGGAGAGGAGGNSGAAPMGLPGVIGNQVNAL